MTTISTAALHVRLREVLEAGFGSVRTITADTYGGNLPEEFSAQGDSVRAVAKPQTEALVEAIRRSPSSPSSMSNVALYEIDVRVRVVRRLTADQQVNATARDLVKAAAAGDADVVVQALTWPGNLTQTQAGTATGLRSGMLAYRESQTVVKPAVDDGASIVETNHLFTGLMQSAPPVS